MQGHAVASAAAPLSPTPANQTSSTPSLPQWPNFSLPAPMRFDLRGGGLDDSIAPRQIPGMPPPAFGPQPGVGSWAGFNRTALPDPLAPSFGAMPASPLSLMLAGLPSIHDALGISVPAARLPGAPGLPADGPLDLRPQVADGSMYPALFGGVTKLSYPALFGGVTQPPGSSYPALFGGVSKPSWTSASQESDDDDDDDEG